MNNAPTEALDAIARLLTYGEAKDDPKGTLFRFDNGARFFLSAKDVDALIAVIGAGGQAANPSTSPAPVQEVAAWMDDGTLRAGSERTAHRVVTDEQKRDMPKAVRDSFTVPLYRHPAPQAPGVSEAMVEALREARQCVLGYIDRCDYSKGHEILARLEAALAQAPAGGEWREEVEYEIVTKNGEFCASTTDFTEANHYAFVYSADGPVDLVEVRRRVIPRLPRGGDHG